MAVNDLTTPLGVAEDKPSRRRLRLPVRAILGGAVLAVMALFAGWVALVDDPLGGEPRVTVAIDMTPPAAAPKPAEAPGAAPPAETNARTATAADLEQQSGVVVVRGGGAAAPPSVIVRAPDPAAAVKLAPPDPALTERGKAGPLPKIGADGRRPADVYARPAAASGAKIALPRLAVLVGGMGISQNGTAEAIAKLPGGVSFAFAPYGSDLDRLVQQARGAGHEVMLQAPMEPFDYPDNDPGPQTLLAAAPADQNLERLHWQMSRFGGYVGITNYMGGKFTASAEALGPILKDVAGRGLIYADDGSSPRSIADQVGASLGLAVPKADMVIDVVPTPQAVDAALAKLEQLARDKGTAFGVATGLPLTVAKLSDWARTLEKRGVQLVPVSELARKQP
ncbi:divergent polysaccharide deacetylase family protein [Labrys wisconsinensis]|uniref:Polysaccharide deacetylase 2 family uncharacterized protein YibQ n=1 Tax=Labrys wisconsinensis TaxID=425677 RepID=A0ABU0J1Y9_9HYPH|nr:divergent polysaccharide deacetylase family protein [Labrys wisconsinensis]MDQ0468266.1 polysaccharide deacetylase 2 family uncharacterized protein YibQ [Labrys wisconsinensis]